MSAPFLPPVTPAAPFAICVIGGPGAGKRTHSVRLAQRFGLHYVSMGDLLWKKAFDKSCEQAAQIKADLINGELVPKSIIIDALKEAVEELRLQETTSNGFLISGFPRRLEDLQEWEAMGTGIPVRICLLLDCPEKILMDRMPLRRASSRSVDDVDKQRRSRLERFKQNSGPVVAEMSSRGVLRKVDSSSYDVEEVWACVQEVMWSEISDGGSLRNQAIVVVKPHAVNDETVRYVQSYFTEHGIAVIRKGEAQEKKTLFDSLYRGFVSTSTTTPASLTITRKEKIELFQQRMGVSWTDALAQGSVVHAEEALKLLNLSASELNALWDKAERGVQLGRTLYVAKLEGPDGKPLHVINGFLPFYREMFVDSEAPAVWMVVRFDPHKISWKDVRGMIIGTTNPATAQRQSIRAQLLEYWQELGLKEPPTTTNNCVHFSDGPLEAIREQMVWTGILIEEEPIARQILARGVPKAFLEELLENPYVESWPGFADRVPVFDATAGCDARKVAIDVVSYARVKCGEGHTWWAVSSPKKSQAVGAADFAMTTSAGEQLKCMTILHFNDVYNIEPLDSATSMGGIARFVTRIRELKVEPLSRGEQEAMILFSGDALSPSLISTVTLGEHMVPALNAVGIEAAVYGNHDFDFGVDHLRTLAKQTNFPWLLSNATDANTGRPLGEGLISKTIDFHGRKIGLIGLIEKEWLVTLATIDMEQVRYEDFVACGRRLAKELKEERGADIVIALTHMRIPNDELLAQEVEEIDIILGGHDHHYEVKPVGPWNTYVLKSGTDFRDITVLRLEFTDDAKERPCRILGHEHVEIGPSIAEDPTMHELVEKYKKVVGEAMDEILGYSAVDLDARFSEIRTKETNIGNFITDIMRRRLKCDAAVLNSGTIRADAIIERGEIKLRHLMNLLPMIDELCILEISGEQLLQVLENGVSQWPRLEGRFLQVSGVCFSWDSKKPGGERILEGTVKVGGKELDKSALYSLGTKDYLRKGKDGFDVFTQCRCIAGSEESGVLPGLMRDLFKSLQALNGLASHTTQSSAAAAAGLKDLVQKFGDGPEPLRRWGIHPEVEGRIVRIE